MEVDMLFRIVFAYINSKKPLVHSSHFKRVLICINFICCSKFVSYTSHLTIAIYIYLTKLTHTIYTF